MRQAVDLLQAQPGLGRTLDLDLALDNAAVAGVRAWSPRGFSSWLLLYRATPAGIVILRFVHAARDLPFHLADGSLGPSPFFQ